MRGKKQQKTLGQTKPSNFAPGKPASFNTNPNHLLPLNVHFYFHHTQVVISNF